MTADPLPARALAIGRLEVAPFGLPLFLPDIDVYFKGDVSIALALLESLKAAGAQVVKGALIHDLDLCFDGPVEASYFKPGSGIVRERYRDVLARHVLPLSDARVIYRRANELGLEIVLTVYDAAGADFALDVGASALKVASSNITHAPLIRDLARRGKPLLIDTGRSSLQEIARAFDWARDAGARDLIVQHSPPAPPADVSHHHLRMMPVLGRLFDCPFGLSDHHAGNEMAIAAAALGAAVIEKGVCSDTAAYDIDIAHAARIGDVAAIIAQITNVSRALGKAMRPAPALPSRPADRMGMVAARALQAGERLAASAVRFAMAVPEETIGVEHWDAVEGATLARPVAAMTPLRWADFAQTRPPR